MNIYVCVQETAFDKVAALSKIQSLHSLQHGYFNLGTSGSLGLRNRHRARKEKKQVMLEFSWAAEGFRNYPSPFFSVFFITFFLWLPYGKKLFSLHVITVIKKENYCLLFLENVQSYQWAQQTDFHPLSPWLLLNWLMYFICTSGCENIVRSIQFWCPKLFQWT